MSRIAGSILTPSGFVRGVVSLQSDGRIHAIVGDPLDEAAVRGAPGPIVVPGFIDTHVHGGGGRDVMEGGDAAATIARLHARHGTTSLLATTMTAPRADLEGALEAVAPHCQARAAGGARILGVHLEGPYLSVGKLGAQPDYARSFDEVEFRRLHGIAPIRVVTLAPEVDANREAIAMLSALGVRVQLGHSEAPYEVGLDALTQGASGFTHLFNAMSGLHHRAPGLAGAALAHADYAEIIPDLLHVHPGAIRAALRCVPRLFCVTDSTSAAGMPDGEYRLGRQAVHKCLGGVRLPDGTLAGSTLTMDGAFRNLVDRLGLSLAEASRRTSTFAADFLGATDRGRIEAGAWADLAVFDRDLRLTAVYAEGEAIAIADA